MGSKPDFRNGGEAEPLLLEGYRMLRAMEALRRTQVCNARSRIVALYEAWGNRRRLGGTALWGIALFLLLTFPVLGFKHFNFLQVSFVSDHFVYHGAPGIFLAVGVLLDRVRSGAGFASAPKAATGRGPTASPSAPRIVVIYAIAAAVLIGCGWLTVKQNRVWENGVTFWEYTLKGNPGCFVGNHNLGNHYYRNKDYETALGYYRQAAQINKTHVWMRRDCARCCRELGDVDEAINHYRDALQVAASTNRFALEVHREYAGYLRASGRLEDALAEYEAILKKSRQDPRATKAARDLSEQLRHSAPTRE